MNGPIPSKKLLLASMITMLVACGSNNDHLISASHNLPIKTKANAEVLSYVGSAACAECHNEQHKTFIKTGHNFKIQKVSKGQQPTFPYTPESTITGAIKLLDFAGPTGDGTTNNKLGAPKSYDEVSYVVGGYHWKMRWLDAEGYIVTGKNVQYNIRNSDGTLNVPANHVDDEHVMGNYKGSKKNFQYKCGNCHTTGWKRTTTEYGDKRNLARQDNLPGMGGTFALQGIQCESCHGAASAHIKAPSTENITKVASARMTADFLAADLGYGKAVTCAECHTRDGEKDYPSYVSHYNKAFPNGSKAGGRIAASGGLSKHHQTGDEMLGVVPENHGDYKAGDEIGVKRDMSCTACHDPHKSTVNQGSRDGLHTGAVKACSACHTGEDKKQFTVKTHEFVAECTDCHMPKLAKSAVKHLGKDGKTVYGDVKSHLFTIDLAPAAKQFSRNGKFQMPWSTAKYSCGECHADVASYVSRLPGGKIHQSH
ncbi:multiheme c-type cytochrome [Shewanella youngdeokensis]|uniref:Multiheme c-type cytochrome n=1 Tax=Shewanella youngdeokensis TaxID=2999068 RepID=A0ABZ0JYW7_9GAMM|nr:multiheme c-type cytochrome [Shewanella sp. DAU334]